MERTERGPISERALVELARAIPMLAGHPRLRELSRNVRKLPPERRNAAEMRKLVEGDPDSEKLVKYIERPALLVANDSFEVPLSDSWYTRLNAMRGPLERAIRSVGRVEVRNDRSKDWLGTAWVIADGIVVTNRHVAVAFAKPTQNGFAFRRNVQQQQLQVVIDFREEYWQTSMPLEIPVTQVLYIAPDDDVSPDVALLLLDPSDKRAPEPLPLADAGELRRGLPVGTIGFPAFDRYEDNQNKMIEIYAGIFDVKRLAPGEVMNPRLPDSNVFEHDCATLGGNSGSVVLSLESGLVVGLHFAGCSGVANYAVSAAALAGILKDHGIKPASRPAALVGAAAERKRSPGEYATRDGYVTTFLGPQLEVGLPDFADKSALAPVDGGGHELKYRHFSVVLHKDRRFPVVAAVNIDGTSLKRVPRARDWSFDPRVEKAFQAGNDIYANNNLDRGHMVRRLDAVWGSDAEAKEANDDTFHYTNACPQEHSFNDGVWGDLEDFILDSSEEDHKLSVFTGPVLADDDPQYRGIQIPRQYWKVVAWSEKQQLRAAAFLMSQAGYLRNLELNPSKLGTWQVSVAEIATLTGLGFTDLARADVLAPDGREAAPRRVPLRRLEDVVLRR